MLREEDEEEAARLEDPHEEGQRPRDRQGAKAVEHPLPEQPADAPDLRGKESPQPRTDRVEDDQADEDEDAEGAARDVQDVEVGEDRASEGNVTVDDEQPEDYEQVEQPFRDDDSDRAGERYAETALDEVAAV